MYELVQGLYRLVHRSVQACTDPYKTLYTSRTVNVQACTGHVRARTHHVRLRTDCTELKIFVCLEKIELFSALLINLIVGEYNAKIMYPSIISKWIISGGKVEIIAIQLKIRTDLIVKKSAKNLKEAKIRAAGVLRNLVKLRNRYSNPKKFHLKIHKMDFPVRYRKSVQISYTTGTPKNSTLTLFAALESRLLLEFTVVLQDALFRIKIHWKLCSKIHLVQISYKSRTGFGTDPYSLQQLCLH